MPQSRKYTQRHYRDLAQILADEREKNGASPVLNRLTAALTELFTQDVKDSGGRPPYQFDSVLFRAAALGKVPVTASRQTARNRAKQAQVTP